ncbi:unnamed protein product [Rangifer tarandus platyrhynchus]|uniref:Uncharacterized protein n=1 Tax=Rangifer tarandus platyrhynchus TaxID=3082113 RepID=A0ABN8Y254_RANTA|nr:unnamed protein product [Rangifer tarandus platyrhynchus]
MPAGGSEDRGPRSAAGPNQTPPGPRVPEPQTGVGRGGADRGRAWRGPGREGDEISAPLSPTPSPGMHTRPAARGPETLQTPVPGQVCWPGLPVCGDGAVSAGLWPARPVERAPAALRLCPREAQRTEGRGPRRARIRHLRGHVSLSHKREWAGGAPTGGGPGEAQAGRATRPPRPSAQPQAQACTPDRPLGVRKHSRPPCRARFAGQGCRCVGTGRFRLGCGRHAPWKGEAGWLDTAHQGEKEAQRRVFKGPWRQPPPSKIIPP